MIENPFLKSSPAVRSLNRAQISALPTLRPPQGVIGLRGYPGLSFAPDEDPQDYGIKLGYFLLMLKRGDAENRAARPDWTDKHWAYWANVRNIVFGGGGMSGKFGRKALLAATNVLAAHGYSRVYLQQSPHGANIGLIGLAQSLPATTRSALLFDFGQTSVKRAHVTLDGDGIAQMTHFPSLPANCYRDGGNVLTAQARFDWLVELIAQSWQSADAIAIALAAYLENGHPVPEDNGCYGCLQQLTAHLPTLLRDELHLRHEIDVPLLLLHDGMAAAAAHPNLNGVVITIGTALGVGFPEETKITGTI